MASTIRRMVRKLKGTNETFTYYQVKNKKYNTKTEALKDLREGRI